MHSVSHLSSVAKNIGVLFFMVADDAVSSHRSRPVFLMADADRVSYEQLNRTVANK